jgi:hypothetical protein
VKKFTQTGNFFRVRLLLMAARKSKVRMFDDPEDRALLKALMRLRIDDVARVPPPPPPADDDAPPPLGLDGRSPDAPPADEADAALLAGAEADNEEFYLPFTRTVEVLDTDGPDAAARVWQLTDSDDHGSESESEGRLGMYPSESSDGFEGSSGSGGRGSD